MKRTLLSLTFFASLLLFLSTNIYGQAERTHSVVAETGGFSTAELQRLSEHLESEFSIIVAGGCRSEGLVLIEVPVSLGLRTHQAESSILQAINTVWNREATISKQTSRETVLDCISED